MFVTDPREILSRVANLRVDLIGDLEVNPLRDSCRQAAMFCTVLAERGLPDFGRSRTNPVSSYLPSNFNFKTDF